MHFRGMQTCTCTLSVPGGLYDEDAFNNRYYICRLCGGLISEAPILLTEPKTIDDKDSKKSKENKP